MIKAAFWSSFGAGAARKETWCFASFCLWSADAGTQLFEHNYSGLINHARPDSKGRW